MLFRTGYKIPQNSGKKSRVIQDNPACRRCLPAVWCGAQYVANLSLTNINYSEITYSYGYRFHLIFQLASCTLPRAIAAGRKCQMGANLARANHHQSARPFMSASLLLQRHFLAAAIIPDLE